MNESSVRPSVDIREILRQTTKAGVKAKALIEVERLHESGLTVRDAVREVAYATGMGERSLWLWRERTNFISREGWEAALVRKSGPERKKCICPPDILKRFIDRCRSGTGVSENYRQAYDEAEAKGLGPIPSENTLRRELNRQWPMAERYAARRNTPMKEGL